MSLNLTWVDLDFSGTKGYPGQVNRHSLQFQEEAVLKYLVVPLIFALYCTYSLSDLSPISGCSADLLTWWAACVWLCQSDFVARAGGGASLRPGGAEGG